MLPEIIDLTTTYTNALNMPRGRAYHRVDRQAEPIRFIHLHHSAGFYLGALTERSTIAQERAEVERMAQDHRSRTDGPWTGPGYHSLVTPAGRIYRVGTILEFRRHLGTGLLNRHGFGICALGDYSINHPTVAMVNAIAYEITQTAITPWTVAPSPQLVPHKDAARPGFTDCPGRFMLNHMPQFRAALSRPPFEEPDDMPEHTHEDYETDIANLLERMEDMQQELTRLNEATVQRYEIMRLALSPDHRRVVTPAYEALQRAGLI